MFGPDRKGQRLGVEHGRFRRGRRWCALRSVLLHSMAPDARRRGRAGQNVDDAHGATAAGAAVDVDAHEVAQALAIIGVAADPRRVGLIEQPPDQRQFALPMAVGKEAVVADAMEAVGQAMEQETADELVGVEPITFALLC